MTSKLPISEMGDFQGDTKKINWKTRLLDRLFPWNKGICRICGHPFVLFGDGQWYNDGMTLYRAWDCKCKEKGRIWISR